MMHRIFFAFIWIIGRVLLWIYRVDVKGLENLPKHSVLLCPNHSTDLDPVLIGLCLPLDYHLHFMAKAELFDNRALAWSSARSAHFPSSATARISSPSRPRCRCSTRVRIF